MEDEVNLFFYTSKLRVQHGVRREGALLKQAWAFFSVKMLMQPAAQLAGVGAKVRLKLRVPFPTSFHCMMLSFGQTPIPYCF
jgi:hypothetical protein